MEHVQTQVDATRKQITLLAKRQRGAKTREEFFNGFEGISFNTYANFESGVAWPRHKTLSQLERLLGWQEGIIEEIEALEVDPATLTLAHMHGDEPLATPATSLSEYPSTALLAELARREAERARGTMSLAASEGGEDGIGPEDEPQD
jgi:hypothetical protein